jgi:CheY-like chemotaxis protein
MAVRKLRVLVAEDNPGMCELVVEILTVWGHSVHAVGDGKEAVRHLREHAPEIELVITDFQMPKMNGIELARQVKKATPDIKVIVMSGFDDLGILMEMVDAAGADAFIRKPFGIEELRATIASVSSELVTS